MTNPISKAIVKAAVAMGYGKKSDYKGSTVAEVLEKFAAIAKAKGGGSGGGGAMYATFTEDNGTWSCDKTYAELRTAYDAGHPVFARYNDLNDVTEGGFTMCAPMCDVVYDGVPALYAKTVVQQGYLGSISVTMHTGQFVIADVGIMAEIESYVVSLQHE